MRRHRQRTQAQDRGDLGVALAFAYPREHVGLALRQRRQRPGAARRGTPASVRRASPPRGYRPPHAAIGPSPPRSGPWPGANPIRLRPGKPEYLIQGMAPPPSRRYNRQEAALSSFPTMKPSPVRPIAVWIASLFSAERCLERPDRRARKSHPQDEVVPKVRRRQPSGVARRFSPQLEFSQCTKRGLKHRATFRMTACEITGPNAELRTHAAAKPRRSGFGVPALAGPPARGFRPHRGEAAKFPHPSPASS